MRMRRIAVAAAMAVVVTVPVVSTGVAAFAKAPAVSRHGDDRKAKKKVVFTAAGKVTAVDGSSLTVAVKGGTKDVRGRTVTFAVADGARVRLNGKRVQVGALVAGVRVTVSGTRTDGVYAATRIEAGGRTPDPKPTPSSSASPMPTSSPSPSVSPSSTPTD